MAAYRLPRPGFRHQCNKVRIGLRTRKSGVASKRVFIGPESVHKTKTKLKLALCLSSKDSLWVCSRSGSLSPSPRSAGRFSLISPQSLELDTGVNHHSLDLLFYHSSPHLISRCILRIPTPPSPQLCTEQSLQVPS